MFVTICRIAPVKKNAPVDHLHDVVCFEYSVNNGDILSWDFVDRDVANFVSRVWRVDKKKDVPTMKRWLHRATRDGLKCNTRSAQEKNR